MVVEEEEKDEEEKEKVEFKMVGEGHKLFWMGLTQISRCGC